MWLRWCNLVIPQPWSTLHGKLSLSLLMMEWIHSDVVSNSTSNKMGLLWNVLYFMRLWQLWLHWNSYIFRNGVIEPKVVDDCVKKWPDFFFFFFGIWYMSPMLTSSKTCIPVSWSRPQGGWFKLNTWWSSWGNPDKLGGDGLLRNNIGEWIKDFPKNSKNLTSIMA